jgi:hypothetical protein
MCSLQILECPHSVALSIQRAGAREKGRNDCAIRNAIGTETETASAESGDGSGDFPDEPLSCIVAELILSILDVNCLKVRLSLCRGRKQMKQTTVGFEHEHHGGAA